jgi:hypothetical protein
VKILIRKYQGTIYPQDNGYTGAIDVGFDGRGNRIRIKRRGRTKAIVREKLIQAADELDAGITTSDGYTVGDAARDWLEKGTRDLDEKTVETYRILIEKHLVSEIGAIKLKKTQREPRRSLARRTNRRALNRQLAQAPQRLEACHPTSSGPRYGRS